MEDLLSAEVREDGRDIRRRGLLFGGLEAGWGFERLRFDKGDMRRPLFLKKKKKKKTSQLLHRAQTSLQKIGSLLLVRLLAGLGSIHFLVLFVGCLLTVVTIALTVAAPTIRPRLTS